MSGDREVVERGDGHRGDDVARRFGGAMVGVGIASGILYLLGSDRGVTGYLSPSILLIGVALLLVGHRARNGKLP